MPKQIGSISDRIVELLNLPFNSGTPILIGESNIRHLKIFADTTTLLCNITVSQPRLKECV